MRKLFLTKGLAAALISFLAIAPATSQAQSTQDIISALNQIRAALDAMVYTAATYIFQTPPNIGNELVTNNTQGNAVQTIAPNVQALNDKDLQAGLVPNTQNPNANLVQMAAIQASDTVLPNSLLGGLPVPFYSQAMQNNLQNALTQGNENMDFQMFFNPCAPAQNTSGNNNNANNQTPTCGLVYSTPSMQNYALNYIRFVSGFATPVSNLSLGSYPQSQLSTQQKINIQNTASYQTYQVQRRQLLALQSALMTNLYHIYQRRLPIQTIHASDTALGIENPSAAQIEDYIATWRTASPTWYTQMSTAAPSVVQRETLFILAEMQAEIHRMHMDNERMIALTAISQFGAIQTGKINLAITEKQVQNQISDEIKKNAASGTTNQNAQQANQNAQQQSQAQQLKQQEEAVKQQQKQAVQQANPNQTQNQ